ncbi:thiamine-phosphate kinase [Coralliovum pocilloporae]|uniref:thiamine-phosphate kinase n=1 Tax=Coralliovum pocilloporae TaxID=3066369 RepID=UPI0033079F96
MGEQRQRPGEFALIAKYLAPLATDPGTFDLTDDTCRLDIPDGQQLVISKDMLVSGMHFLATDPPDLIARKALRVNISDLTAKGAEAAGYMLGLSLPDDWTEDWLQRFSEGLGRDAAVFSLGLLGGDTVKSGSDRLTISVTVFGWQPKGTRLTRGGARPGDHLYVSGVIGDSALGLLLHRGDQPTWVVALDDRLCNELINRYLLPGNRQDIRSLVLDYASASMDISDGLVGDLRHICVASGCGARLETGLVPMSEAGQVAASVETGCLQTMLTGGDDYEVLLTVPDDRHKAFQDAVKMSSVPFTRIGVMTEGSTEIDLKDADGQSLVWEQQSFSHF